MEIWIINKGSREHFSNTVKLEVVWSSIIDGCSCCYSCAVAIVFFLSGFHKEKYKEVNNYGGIYDKRIQHVIFIKQVAWKRDQGKILKTAFPMMFLPTIATSNFKLGFFFYTLDCVDEG